MHEQILKRQHIEEREGISKPHFLNPQAHRTNKSLGDWSGLTGFGFHLVEVQPGLESTEFHVHHQEDECVYILQGEATVTIGDASYPVEAGDFIAYPANGEPHTMQNTGRDTLKCIVVGQRLKHDIVDYPRLGKRLYRASGLPWNLVDTDAITEPEGGRKA